MGRELYLIGCYRVKKPPDMWWYDTRYMDSLIKANGAIGYIDVGLNGVTSFVPHINGEYITSYPPIIYNLYDRLRFFRNRFLVEIIHVNVLDLDLSDYELVYAGFVLSNLRNSRSAVRQFIHDNVDRLIVNLPNVRVIPQLKGRYGIDVVSDHFSRSF
jgi:hypothetical protein